jgi:GT2 family glycosyltransferase
MNISLRFTIIIPTKNRRQILEQLLGSIGALNDIDRILPEIIVADNNSDDDTQECVNSMAKHFPTTLRSLKIVRAGKSAALNDAVKTSTGNVLAFLDDDVVVDKAWLVAVREFFQEDNRQVGQGFIGLQSTPNDPEITKLVEIYRTIPRLEYNPNVGTLHSLNGANFFMSRELFNRVGGFDERLGPGASGTSEDVDLARRLIRSGVSISYAPKAVVYHRIDRDRLTEAYFKQSHRRQGVSRFLIRKQGGAEILFNLLRVATQYGYYTLLGQERNRYRSKGRIYHYLGMIEAKKNDSTLAGTKEDLRTRSPHLT